VKFNNEPVPNSPFECSIRNTSVSVSGAGIKMCSVNSPVTFAIAASKEETKLYEISVLSPSGKKELIFINSLQN